jgi:type VII secretion system ESX-1 transmembrane protein EccB
VQTQKDHVDAYSFLMGRMTAALVTGDASHPEVPARRTWTGLLVGALLAALITAGFLIYGLIA